MKRRDFLKVAAVLPALGLTSCLRLKPKSEVVPEDAFDLEAETRKDLLAAERAAEEQRCFPRSGIRVTLWNPRSGRRLVEGRDYICGRLLSSTSKWPAGRPLIQFAPHMRGAYDIILLTAAGDTYRHRIETTKWHVTRDWR